MRIKLQITQLAGGREIVLEAERDRHSRRDEFRWAAENEHRYGMALEAIRRSPDSAEQIATDALYDEPVD